MKREENFSAGTGTTVSATENTDGTETIQINATGVAGPSALINTSLTSLVSGVMDLGSASIMAPADGVVLMSLAFSVQLLSTSAGQGYVFNYGYGTTGSAFVADETGTEYQDPSDTNEDTFTYIDRISVSAGSNTFHALFQVLSGALPPSGGTAKVKVRGTLCWVAS